MKKHVKTRQLNRDHNARKALFRGLINSLIEHEEIETTAAKARAVRGMFEKLITKGRVGSLHARRQIQSFLQHQSSVKKLVDEISPRFKNTAGGYTKLTIIGNRRGDNAPIVKLSLTKTAPLSAVKPIKNPKNAPSTKPKSRPSAKKSILPTPPEEAPKPVKQAPATVLRGGKRGDR